MIEKLIDKDLKVKMLRKISRSVADMNSGEKVLLTGAIYFILLGLGTVGFQHIEEEAMLERCER